MIISARRAHFFELVDVLLDVVFLELVEDGFFVVLVMVDF